jgi:hypothetical protein
MTDLSTLVAQFLMDILYPLTKYIHHYITNFSIKNRGLFNVLTSL